MHCTVLSKKFSGEIFHSPHCDFHEVPALFAWEFFFGQNISFRDENLLCSTLTLHFPVFPWTGDLKKLGDSHHGPKIVLNLHSNFYTILSKGMLVVVMCSDLFVSLFNFDKQAKLGLPRR